MSWRERGPPAVPDLVGVRPHFGSALGLTDARYCLGPDSLQSLVCLHLHPSGERLLGGREVNSAATSRTKGTDMKFHNPWIDPRIVQATPEAAQVYLHTHGWKLIGPAANPALLLYERPENGDNTASVLVPVQLDQGSMLQRMIDLVADLARHENRWAVDVLRDILLQPGASTGANGPTVAKAIEPAPK